jgi:predicted MFS family arabinose efflux permease
MIGAFGAGSVIGSFAGRKLHERNEARALILGTIVMGATTAGIALSPWFPPVLALLLVCGAADAVIMIADRSIQQRRTPDAVRSRVVGASEAMIDIALSIGFVLGGPAVAALGPRATYAIGGACGLLGAVVLVPVLRASRRTPVAEAIVEQEPIEADELVVARVAG